MRSPADILTTKMDSDQFMHLLAVEGHPLILELINRGNVAETFHATEVFVEKEIFSRLSGTEKRLLGAIAVFKNQFPSTIHQMREASI